MVLHRGISQVSQRGVPLLEEAVSLHTEMGGNGQAQDTVQIARSKQTFGQAGHGVHTNYNAHIINAVNDVVVQ